MATDSPNLPVTPSATLVGLLADDERLRVFAAVALGARTVEAVARQAELEVAAVQAVLPRLISSGLITQGDGLGVSLEALRASARERPPRQRGLPDATAEQQDVLRNFVEDGRFVRLPARHGQRRVVLEYVATRFDRDRPYLETEVNDLLKSLHPDYASLRRYLVDEGLLQRERGLYRRT
jgi:hypothetical protein